MVLATGWSPVAFLASSIDNATYVSSLLFIKPVCLSFTIFKLFTFFLW
jgi:hypothetical protein